MGGGGLWGVEDKSHDNNGGEIIVLRPRRL